MKFEATIVGSPRTKKNHSRIVRRGNFTKLLPSEAYERWEAAAVPQLRIARAGRAPIAGDVHVAAVFYRDRAQGDLVNYMQALADTLQKAGVIQDDRQIVSWDQTRLAKDKEKPRVELRIMELEFSDGTDVKHPYEE
jgi:Holliday junction resolvase RusA-like endonuclease